MGHGYWKGHEKSGKSLGVGKLLATTVFINMITYTYSFQRERMYFLQRVTYSFQGQRIFFL